MVEGGRGAKLAHRDDDPMRAQSRIKLLARNLIAPAVAAVLARSLYCRVCDHSVTTAGADELSVRSPCPRPRLDVGSAPQQAATLGDDGVGEVGVPLAVDADGVAVAEPEERGDLCRIEEVRQVDALGHTLMLVDVRSHLCQGVYLRKHTTKESSHVHSNP